MTKIINWKTKETIIDDSNLSTIQSVEEAVDDGISLAYADFRGLNLVLADLRYANFRGADLRGADLRGADLGYADLHGVDLRGIKINKDQVDDLLIALGVKIV